MEKPLKKGLSGLCDYFIDPREDPHEKRIKSHAVFMWPKFARQDIFGSKNLQVKAFKAYEGRGTLEFPPLPIPWGRKEEEVTSSPKKYVITIEGAKDQTS